MAVENLAIHLAERPAGEIVAGKTFTQKTTPAPSSADLKDGEILVEILYLSLDPAMRLNMSDRRSYAPPAQIGGVMPAGTVSRVVASKSKLAAVGESVFSWTGMTQYAVLKDGQFEPQSSFPGLKEPQDMISVLGLTAVTSWVGIMEIADPKPGELVVVSGAAGATGSVAGQIAKIQGATVVGIAGTDEKCRWLTEELGFDTALNYKSKDFKEKFDEATKSYINVYFDGVGGEILDMALGRAQEHARFIECGLISQYNGPDPKPLRNFTSIVTMRIRMQGFLVLDYADKYPQARADLGRWYQEGKLKKNETILKGGLKVAEQGLIDLFKGANTGKMLVEVKDPNSELAQL